MQTLQMDVAMDVKSDSKKSMSRKSGMSCLSCDTEELREREVIYFLFAFAGIFVARGEQEGRRGEAKTRQQGDGEEEGGGRGRMRTRRAEEGKLERRKKKERMGGKGGAKDEKREEGGGRRERRGGKRGKEARARGRAQGRMCDFLFCVWFGFPCVRVIS